MYVPMPKSRTWRASITMCSGILGPDRVELPMIQREPGRQRADLLAHCGQRALIGNVGQHFADQPAYLAHLGFLKTDCGGGRRGEPEAAWIEWGIGSERNRVLVHGDSRPVERLLRLFAANALGKDIQQQQMSVRTARNY